MGIFDSNYDFNKYKFFYAVATCKSFSKAADLLHISQPAISYSIKELEEQLDTQLFIRNKNGVILTETAEKLLLYVKKAFDNILIAQDILKEEKNDLSGTVRIGIYTHVAMFLIPNAIKDFKNKYPNAKFFLYSTSHDEMVDKLKNKELDVLILQYPIFFKDYNFTEEVLFETETGFFSDKTLYEKYIKNGNKLNDIPVSLPLQGYQDVDNMINNLKENDINFNHAITCYNTDLGKEIAKNGVCATWGIKKCFEKELRDKELFELPMNIEFPKSKFSIVYNEEFVNNTTKEFIKMLKENIDKYVKK